MVQRHRGWVDVVGSLVGVRLSVYVEIDVDSCCGIARSMAIRW